MANKLNAQICDPSLGRSAKNGATDTCSKCGHSIPEEHVPLIAWNEGGDLMWVYCEKCEGSLLARAIVRTS